MRWHCIQPFKEEAKMNVVRILLVCCLLCFSAANVSAQGNNGRGKCMQPYPGVQFQHPAADHGLTGERLSVAEASFRGIDSPGIPAAEPANTDMTEVGT
jgi:hypothetical protein